PDILERHVTPQGRDLRNAAQHLPKPRYAGRGERLDGAGGDPVDADPLWTQVRGQKTHVGLEARLGEAHDVVAGDGAQRAEGGDGKERTVAACHERVRTLRERGEAVARNIVRNTEALASRGPEERPGEGLARRECYGR